jgi:hypothetical protein
MATVGVIIFHAKAPPSAGPLATWVAAERGRLAEDHRLGFEAAGADEARIVAGLPDGVPFGARLREVARRSRHRGLVVLGSGAIPLATSQDRQAFVEAARADDARALTNNRYSGDIVAVARAAALAELPDLTSDNALPRWLAEVGGFRVDERPGWRLRLDIDDPLDLVLLSAARRSRSEGTAVIDTQRVAAALARVADVARVSSAELVVAGRTSAATLRWLERHTAARVRALVEERGLRAADPAASAPAGPTPRPPVSVLGELLDRAGPAALGETIARLGDAALLDTRVLLAHRLGADERAWPNAEDRFASDLLLHERIDDAWLRALTRSAAEAPIPIVLGGHTLVGPGTRVALRFPAPPP